MAEDEPHPAIKKEARAVHPGLATRVWFSPLLLVQLGGAFLGFAWRRTSRFLGCASVKKHQ
ncbi:MAG: hypothetical protein ABJO54_19690, partial [Hyphomicrobiales bacterium]